MEGDEDDDCQFWIYIPTNDKLKEDIQNENFDQSTT